MPHEIPVISADTPIVTDLYSAQSLPEETATFYSRIDIIAPGVESQSVGDLTERADKGFAAIAYEIGRMTSVETIVIRHDWAYILDPQARCPRWDYQIDSVLQGLPPQHSLVARVERITRSITQYLMPDNLRSEIMRAFHYLDAEGLRNDLASSMGLDPYDIKDWTSLTHGTASSCNKEPSLILHDIDLMLHPA